MPLAITQLSQLLAREPFMIPNFVYFYCTYLPTLNTLVSIAVVALLSFWIEPGPDELTAPQGVTQ